MRSVPYSLAVAALGLSNLIAQPAFAQAPKPAQILGLKPTQAGVEFDTPTDPAAIEACKVEIGSDPKKKTYTYALRDGQGKLLRRFMDTDGDRNLDQWSYYQDGFEVYRENDLDGNKSVDECRWLNSGGTRIARVEGGQIKSWKQISAEEASKVLVQGLVSGKVALLETVLATPEELKAAGLTAEDAEKVAPAADRVNQIKTLHDSLLGWTKDTVWNRFDGTYPHVIPADPGTGPSKEITLYENAVIFAGLPAGQTPQNSGKVAFLQVPEMIKLGEVWKFVTLPRAVDPEKPVVSVESGIRAALFHRDTPPGGQARDEAMEAPLRALADYDAKNADRLRSGEKRDLAKFHLDRIKYVRDIVAAAKDPDDKLMYDKQTVDSLIAAYRTGLYTPGKKAIAEIIAKGGKLGSYAAYNLIGAEFALKNEDAGGDFRANQKKWMADIEEFLTTYEKSDEAADARLQLANANEFDAEEAKAKADYLKLVENHPDTLAGKKAAGALRRLDLTGKPIAIKGAGVSSEQVDSSKFQGKPIVIVFWASWAAPSKRELPELVKLYEKHRKDGLEIIGVSLDNEKDETAATIKEQQIAWPQIFEGGGMESRLASEYGIISLPTIFLVDAQGKVVNRNIRSAAEVERQVEKMLANPAGVAARDR